MIKETEAKTKFLESRRRIREQTSKSIVERYKQAKPWKQQYNLRSTILTEINSGVSEERIGIRKNRLTRAIKSIISDIPSWPLTAARTKRTMQSQLEYYISSQLYAEEGKA